MVEEIYAQYDGKICAGSTYVCVQGHQDDNLPDKKLSIPAQYSVKADELAEKGMIGTKDQGQRVKYQCYQKLKCCYT